jgi:ATP-binding cassette subfamily B (MDR/TAP) protein 1
MIYVFDAGRVVESGSHDELMGKRGRYWELVRLQELGSAIEAGKGE